LPLPHDVLRRLELSAQVRDRVRKMTHPDGLDACQRSLGARFVRTDDALELGTARALGDGKDAADTTQAPVERKLSAGRVLSETGAGELVRRRQERQRDRQIESGAFLLQFRGCQVDCDVAARKLQLRGEDPTPDPLPRLLTGTVGEPDDRQRRHTALKMRLHLHAPGLEADEGKGDRAREHPPRLRGQL
jgi:hypothetical protein